MARLLEAARLAGFAAAHAVWCVSTGETLIPLILWSNEAGERSLERMDTPTLEEGVALQEERMELLSKVARYAVAAFDGYINENGLRADTIFLSARDYNDADDWIKFGVPYTPKKLLRKFAVHPLRLLDGIELDDREIEQIANAFYGGVDEHPKGSKVWAKHAASS